MQYTIQPRSWRVAAIVVMTFIASPAAWAIVNIEDMRSEEASLGFSGQLSFSAGGERGNTDKSTVGAGARTQWKHDRTLDFLVFNYNTGKTEGKRDVNNAFLHGRHIHQLDDEMAWEIFAQIGQNEFQRLSYRALGGGGGRFTLYRQPDGKTRWIVGAGAFYEREDLDEKAGTTDAGIETTTRANLYLVFNYRLNSLVRLQGTAYYQPSFEDVDDFRALAQASLLVQLAERLDLKLQMDAAYDSRPPQLVERGDLVYSTGIEYRF